MIYCQTAEPQEIGRLPHWYIAIYAVLNIGIFDFDVEFGRLVCAEMWKSCMNKRGFVPWECLE